MADKPRVIILGAGVAGLSAAWALSRKGYDVRMLEKSDRIGGLAVTLQRDDYLYDLGPHNFHTRHEHILAFMKRRFSSFYSYFCSQGLVKGGKRMTYPIMGHQVLTTLPLWKLPIAGLQFVAARCLIFLLGPRDDSTFERWVVQRFGQGVYREYFKEYPEKVWRLPTSQIDRYVADRRIPITGLLDLIRGLFLRKEKAKDNKVVFDKHFYLKKGIGEIPQSFARGAIEAGAKIEQLATVTRIEASSGKARRVAYKSADGREQTADCDYLLSTIPLTELVALFDSVPEGTRKSTSELGYCSTLLLFLKIGKPDVLDTALVSFTEGKVPFSRVTDMAKFSREMCPPGKTMLCLEFPCSIGDSVWTSSDEELARQAIAILAENRLLDPKDVEGQFVERVTHSYPQFRLGFRARVKECFRYLSTFDNVVSYGRQGGFAYINTDEVTNLGFLAAGAVTMAEATGMSCLEWYLANAKPDWN